MGCSCWSESTKASASMILVQVFATGMMLLSKLVLSGGTFVFALLAYRNAIGALCILPLALFFESEMRRKVNLTVMIWIFFNALFGISMALGLYFYGLRDTTAAFSSNFLNMIPIMTFILAIVLRLERLRLGTTAGNVKVLGTFFCVGGAMVVSLYKGKVLHIWPSLNMQHTAIKDVGEHHWLRGTLFLCFSCIGYALWFIIQAKLFTIYPSRYWTTMLTSAMGCLQAIVVGIIMNRKKASWRLEWDLQLVTYVYSGILSTAATFCLISWAISKRGPTYPPMFNSLSVILTTILEFIFMGQEITSGSLLGMFIIIGGLYAFLWGKGKELPPQKVQVGDIRILEETIKSQSITIDLKAADHRNQVNTLEETERRQSGMD